MYWIASLILAATYLLLPAASLMTFFFRPVSWLRRHVVGAWISGAILGATVLAAYIYSIGGHASLGQIALTLYLAVALLLLLKIVDQIVLSATRQALRVKDDSRRGRRLAASVVRVVVFATFALPWVMSTVMVYRPRLEPDETPANVLGVDYADVQFAAPDGTRIAGWFVPADFDEGPSTTTALLCHGLGSSKAGFFSLMKALHEQRINVLLIDHRAHGRSGGQRCTFGASEALDVRGAIDWLKADQPERAQRIVGVGASMGGAALLREAADDDRMDAVVLLGTYETMPVLVRDIARRQLVPPISWVTRAFGLSIASLHAGVDLSAIRPVDSITHLWPRPVLVVHGTEDEVIPFDHGRRLFDAAFQPRQSMWIQSGTHNGILENPQVQQRMIDFIRSARPVPVV